MFFLPNDLCVAGVAPVGVCRQRRRRGRLLQQRPLRQPGRGSAILEHRRGKKCSFESIILIKESILFLKKFCYLQANEAQALLEVPGRSGLAGSTAEAVAMGLGRAQSSSRQPLSGLRPLGLRMEVCHSFINMSEPLGLFVLDPQIFSILLYFCFYLFHHLVESKFSNRHQIRCH